MSHHYAFHVSDAEFDAILQRVGGTVSRLIRETIP